MALNVPVRYVGITEPAHAEWLQEHLMDNLTEKLLGGKIQPPGNHQIPAADPPVDGEVAGVQIPDALHKTWHAHPNHGAEFRAWVDTFNEEFPKPEKKSTNKRPAPSITGAVNPNKSQKVGGGPIDMTNMGKLIVNSGDEPKDALLVTIPEGTSLCGFGRGQFRFGSDESKLNDHEIPYKIKDGNEIAVMDSRVYRFSDLMETQRLKSPDKPVLQYYESKFDMVEQKWDLKQVDELIFTPRAGEDKEDQTTCLTRSLRLLWLCCMVILMFLRRTEDQPMTPDPRMIRPSDSGKRRPVGFHAVAWQPGREAVREAHVVVLPEFQGIGLGPQLALGLHMSRHQEEG
eukprot:s3056_g1.t1